jgi:hypothetical protein
MAHSFIVPARAGQFSNRPHSSGIRKQPFATLGVIAPVSGAIEAVSPSSAIRWTARRRQADTVKEKGIGKIAIA